MSNSKSPKHIGLSNIPTGKLINEIFEREENIIILISNRLDENNIGCHQFMKGDKAILELLLNRVEAELLSSSPIPENIILGYYQ